MWLCPFRCSDWASVRCKVSLSVEQKALQNIDLWHVIQWLATRMRSLLRSPMERYYQTAPIMCHYSVNAPTQQLSSVDQNDADLDAQQRIFRISEWLMQICATRDVLCTLHFLFRSFTSWVVCPSSSSSERLNGPGVHLLNQQINMHELGGVCCSHNSVEMWRHQRLQYHFQVIPDF